MTKPSNEQERLGEMLVKAKLISPQQLKDTLKYQQTKGGRFGEIIEKLGFITEQALTDFIAHKQGLKVIDTGNIVWPEALVKRIPKSLIEKHTFLPLSKHEDVLTIVIADSTDFDAIEEIQLFTDMRVEVVLAYRSVIKKAIDKIFSAFPSTEDETTKSPEAKMLEEVKAIKGNSETKINALIQVLISKNIINKEELNKKIVELNKYCS